MSDARESKDSCGCPLSASTREVRALRVSEAEVAWRTEAVAVEIRADVLVEGVFWTSTTLSPDDLVDYAYGAAFAGGLITCSDDVAGVDVRFDGEVVQANVRLRTPREAASRTATTRAFEPLPPEAIWRMSRALLSAQSMHQMTGATHAAVFADRAGAPVLMREDVGRHNAVDKLVGALIRANVDVNEGFAYLSSRCALELVAKLARVGVRVVATVSAPTSAVLDFAEREGIALCAFARGERFTVYAHPELIAL